MKTAPTLPTNDPLTFSAHIGNGDDRFYVAFVGLPDTVPHPVTSHPVRRWHAFRLSIILRPVYAVCGYVVPEATPEQVAAALFPDLFPAASLDQLIPPGLTAEDFALFLDYARDADNWNGTPLIGGNVESDRSTTARLTRMKQAGLLRRALSDGHRWIVFTPQGKALAALCGIPIGA